MTAAGKLHEEFEPYLHELFKRALDRSGGYNTILTVLRFPGLQDARWDPFEESLEAVEDYNWLLSKAKERGERCGLRIGLLMYCQLIEMNSVHEMLANLLRCIDGKTWIITPFSHLQRGKNPPPISAKYKEIRDLAQKVSETKLSDYIESFLNEDIRNAFSHSDYIFTDTSLRWRNGRRSIEIGLTELKALLFRCFQFFGAFIRAYKNFRFQMGKIKRFHKLQPFEVLELLSNPTEGLYGFHVHFSNGQRASIIRDEKGIHGINTLLNRDGSLNFMAGDLDDLEKVWKVNGVSVSDWAALEMSNSQDSA